MDPYASHLWPLAKAAVETAKISDRAMELGCGDYSTPVLRAVFPELYVRCSDREWGERHGAEVLPWSESITGEWGFVFLDNEELVVDREKRLPHLVRISTVVVMHDARGIPSYYGKPAARYTYLYTGQTPHTLVLSDTVDVAEWF